MSLRFARYPPPISISGPATLRTLCSQYLLMPKSLSRTIDIRAGRATMPRQRHTFTTIHVWDEVCRAFPECQPLLELARVVRQGSPPLYNRSMSELGFLVQGGLYEWGDVPSVEMKIFLYALEVATKYGCPLPNDLAASHLSLHHHDVLELASTYMPWAIPTADEVKYALRKYHKFHETCYTTRIGRISCFSAAAVAIKFLHDTPIPTRKYIRKIVIHEDRTSVASPEFHAKGLIPFCVENASLRIERRLDMWRTCFLDYGAVRNTVDAQYVPAPSIPCWWARETARWLVEAGELIRAGMPERSFSLIIDGGPAPEKASYIFGRIQRDAAWQEAFEEACARNSVPRPKLYEWRRSDVHILEQFPSIVRSMTNDKSFIVQCNFDIGAPWDIEGIIEQNQNCPLSKWEEKWWQEDETYSGVEPFPLFKSWRDFYVAEYIYPAEQWRYADEETSFQLSVDDVGYPED
ncbi:hypothetical protein F4777DRAFT_569529 [Nemania sp. FL0916]|nr:hypothetical protein F4777DRAFT_569529 [Nemania sp. FL0916]